MQLGEPFDVQFINNGLVPWRARRVVVAPGKSWINDYSQWGIGGVVAVVKRQIRFRVANTVGKKLIGPSHIPTQGFGIGVEHNLVGIKAMSLLRLEGSVHTIAVELAREHLWQIDMPDLVGVFRHNNTVR